MAATSPGHAPRVRPVAGQDRRLSRLLKAFGYGLPPDGLPSDGRAWLIEEGSAPLGYAIALPAPGLPGVYDLEGAILPARRRQGVGRLLLAAVRADLSGGPARQLSVPVDSLRSPAACFLLAQGFRVGHVEWQLILDEPAGLPAFALPAGFTFQTYPLADTMPLFRRLYEQAFAGLAWFQPYADDREVAAELADADDLLYLAHGAELVGFAWLRYSAEEAAQVEPIGLIPAYQGRGLGRLLMLGALQRLAAQGAERCLVSLWEENRRAMNLYLRLGFRRHRPRTFLALELAP